MTKRFELSVLLMQEKTPKGFAWVAQCLEYDVTAQGDSIASAQENFKKAFFGQIIADISVGKEPLDGIAQAPRFYWSRFKGGQRLAESGPFYMGDGVPEPYMIQAMAREAIFA
jgi:hypothetical protein